MDFGAGIEFAGACMVIPLVVSIGSFTVGRLRKHGVSVVWSLFLVGLGLGPGRCDLFWALVKMKKCLS